MKIGLFIPSFRKYDAMGNDVYSMYKILVSMKHHVIIYAIDYDENIDANIAHVNESSDLLNDKAAIAIYHHGVYTDFYKEIVSAKCKTIFRYHNITSPELFYGYDDVAVEMCKKGRAQMKNTVQGFDQYLSCSHFNNNELIQNFDVDKNKTSILPPFHHVEAWDSIDEDLGLKKYLSTGGVVHILTVGRLSPNKNHQLLIKSFAEYKAKYNHNSILHIVGKLGPEKYYKEIRELIFEYKLEKDIVLYIDGISEEKLKTLYSYCDVFLMTSLHEGFCVPVVEAMYFSLPIISSFKTALKDTVGKNGIVVDNLNPVDFSCAIKIVLDNKEMMSLISNEGYQRYSATSCHKRFIELFSKISSNKIIKQLNLV